MPNTQKECSKEDVRKSLTQTALRFLGYRARFKREIEIRLKKEIDKKFPKEFSKLIPDILTKLEESDLINDQELINTYIKTQQEAKLRGPFFIKQRLFKMGAPQDLVDKSINRFVTQQSQIIAIDKLIKKYKPDLKNIKSVAKFQRLLIYRGFSLSLIKEKIAFSGQKE